MRFLVLALLGTAFAHEPRFSGGDCDSATCYVSVDDPGVSQVFYETIHEGKVIVFEFSDSLGDNPLLVEVYTPIEQGRKMCSGAQVSVNINKEAQRTWYLDSDSKTGFFEPFTQTALHKIGGTYENNEPLDVDDTITIRVSGPTHALNCKVAISVGKEERLEFSTLFAYPIVSIEAWQWSWKSDTYRIVVGFMVASSLAIVLVLWSLRSQDGWHVHFGYAAFAFYLMVFLIRIAFMIHASATARDPTPSAHAWAALICIVDIVFLFFVGIYIFGKWFQRIAESLMCCQTLCCSCRCIFACLEEGQSRAASILIIVISIGSLFVFSPGFYLGPVFLLLSGILALRGNDIYVESFAIY